MAQDSKTGGQFILHKQGGPFELVQVPIPTPASDEIVVKTKAIAVNPLDWKQMYMGVMVQKWPHILGNEGSGVVMAVGEGVGDGWKVGDEVMGYFSSAFADYVSVKPWQVGHKPKTLSFEDAASLPVGFLTAAGCAYGGLEAPLNFLTGATNAGNKPKSILILGGSSAVGSAAIQILRLALPSTTILTTCSAPHHANAKTLGAAAAFNPRSPDALAEIRAATDGGEGVEAILDAVSGVATQPELLELLTGPKLFAEVPTGRNVDPAKLPKDVQFKAAGMWNLIGLKDGAGGMAALTDLIEKGQYKVPIRVEVAGNGLESLEGALGRLREGVSGTKIVVSV